MDTNAPDASPQLQLDPAADAASAAAAEAGATIAAAAAAAAPEPQAPEKKPAAREGSRAATKARVTNPKPKTGKRQRKKPEAETEAVEDLSGRVPVVLKTSRYTGRKGRAIARKTTVLVTVDRGLKLIMLDHAREATEAETLAAAKADPIFLD